MSQSKQNETRSISTCSWQTCSLAEHESRLLDEFLQNLNVKPKSSEAYDIHVKNSFERALDVMHRFSHRFDSGRFVAGKLPNISTHPENCAKFSVRCSFRFENREN